MNFDDFYAEQRERVYWYIFKKINNEEEAHDLTEDVFVACYKHFDRYDSEKSSISTWLFVIVNNRLKNYYRDRKQNVSLDEQTDERYIGVGGGMEQAVELEDYRNMLADAIAELPEKYQLIIILKYFGEKHSDDIAKIVGMSSVNVRVTLSRALKKINDYFVKHGWDGEF